MGEPCPVKGISSIATNLLPSAFLICKKIGLIKKTVVVKDHPKPQAKVATGN